MSINAINFNQKLELFNEHWTPKIIAQLNDYHFKLVKVQGEFVWHDHPETDEVFIVLKGNLHIAMDNETILIKEGEMVVIPKGVRHKPFAEKECHVLLVEPAGTINTGELKEDLTAPNDAWI